jgi:TRAP transporter TAXI family solute receptor
MHGALRAAGCLFGVIFFAMADAPAIAASTSITVATAGAMGGYRSLGGAICRMVNATRKSHRLRCSVVLTEGSVANIRDVLSGAVDMGIAQGDTLHYARVGEGPFRNAPHSNLRRLFSLYPEVFTLIVRKDAGIRRFEDLRGKRVAIGTEGSGTRATVDLALKAFGVERSELKSAVELGFVDLAAALCENRIDAFALIDAHPNLIVEDAASGCPAEIIPVTGQQIDALLAARPYFEKAQIPGGVYRGTASARTSFGTAATVVVAADMPVDTAYAITKAVFDHFDDFRKLHPALAPLTKEAALKAGDVPLHPGAVKYFMEVGLM